MLRFHTARAIAAPPSVVWQILVDRDVLRSGDFGITRLQAPARTLAPGQTIRLTARVSGDRVFKLRVTAMKEPEHMVWEGGMPFGLFKGTRTFRLTQDGDGTLFDMEEVFSGPLAGLIGKTIPDLNASFALFAEALARHAERTTP